MTEAARSKRTPGEMAQSLADEGWYVFPLAPARKVPLLPRRHARGDKCRGECGQDGHGAYDGTRDPERIRRWWDANPTAGIAANCGDDLVVFDLDVYRGARVSTAFPPTRVHWSGRGGGSRHLIYRYTPGSAASRLRPGKSPFDPHIDVKTGRGSYVVAPGSLHEDTLQPYTVGPENGGKIATITDEQLQEIFRDYGAEIDLHTVDTAPARPALRLVDPATTSQLSDLLRNPAAEGGRNLWLTQVAGHYAKAHRTAFDLYVVEVERAAAMLTPPLDPAEVDSVAHSIWETEHDTHPERALSAASGWLAPGPAGLECQVQRRDPETNETVYTTAPWSDFDLRAVGVAVEDDGHRSYWVQIVWGGREVSVTVDGDLFGDDRAVRRWLASFGCTIDAPDSAYPRTAPGVRLQRYIQSQEPPEVHIVDTLGWDARSQAFVTHDGVILPTGPRAKTDAGVVADPQLQTRGVAQFHYGFEGSPEEFRAVLAEVMTYHDQEVCERFGGWWAAALVKPQLQAEVSMFPIFGVEAASESGKTNGFFRLMVELAGNTRGHIVPTRPVLRDVASAHRNGLVWVDDVDDVAAFGELLRASTSNGTSAKMDADRTGIKSSRIVSPVFITGEQLGLSQQKALADRSIVVRAGSPVGRKSQRPGAPASRPQWEDIVELRARYSSPDGLAVLAGWAVQLALSNVPNLLRFVHEVKSHLPSGRQSDIALVELAGAALLGALLGIGEPFALSAPLVARALSRVQEKQAEYLPADNTLTTSILPWALRMEQWPTGPAVRDLGRFSGIQTSVFVVGDMESVNQVDGSVPEVWVSTPLLADMWARDHSNRVDARTESLTALQQQADRVCAPGSSKPWHVSGSSKKARYRKLLPEYAIAVLNRSHES